MAMSRKKLSDFLPAVLSAVLRYLPAFLIPVGLSVLLSLFYQTGLGTAVPYSFAVYAIFLRGIAGICCFAFFRHTKAPVVAKTGWRLGLSCAYSLCAYGMVQPNAAGTLCVYAVFPLLFLFLEKLLQGSGYLYFIFLLTAVLLVSPGTALPVLLLLLVFFFALACVRDALDITVLCRFIGCVFLSVCTAGIRLFPYLASCYEDGAAYTGFSAAYSPVFFLSRFLPGSVLSVALSETNGMDLYFGMFFLFAFFLFFTEKHIPVKKRICYFIVTAILILSVELSPLRYLLSLFTAQDDTAVGFCFLLIFWAIYLAAEALAKLSRISVFSLLFAIFLTALAYIPAWLGYSDNYHPIARMTFFLFMALELLVLLALRFVKSAGKGANALLLCLVLLELCCSAFISTNLNFVPSGADITARYPWDSTDTEAVADSAADTEISADSAADTETYADSAAVTLSDEEYAAFLSTYQYTDTYSLVAQLLNNVSLEDDEAQTYGGKALLNAFEEINARCRKIGCTEDLFTEAEDVCVTFPASSLYEITQVDAGLYNLFQRDSSYTAAYYYLPFTVTDSSGYENGLFLHCDYSNNFLYLDEDLLSGKQTGYLRFTSQPDSYINYQIDIYELNEALAETLPELLTAYLASNTRSAVRASDYIGIAATCIGVLFLLLLFFNRDRQKLYDGLSRIPNGLSKSRILNRLRLHFAKNRIYYFAFLLPCCAFLASMIIFDCVPFADQSFYEGDGLVLTLASNLDYYSALSEGNQYLSLNGGYGYSLYANNPTLGLLSFYRLFSRNQLASLMLLGEALCLGFCGFAIAYYLTHRLTSQPAEKDDCRLLIPALAYSLNAYMLAMRGFTGWYYVFLLFPFLLLSLEYLLYRKKTFAYVLLLSCCMILNLYLSLYICIFFILYFLTSRFADIKDFFKKGIRFALCSILAAGNSIFVIANILLSNSDSAYQDADSVFPSLGFHTSFWNEWKQHMIFSENVTTTSDDGFVNLYCGFLTLLLVVLFLSAKKLSRSERLRKLIPILILYLSFNGQVLSYLWNGFHYQSMTPNRYAFLLLFTLAVLSYDGIRLLPSVSVKRFCLTGAALTAFLVVCYLLGDTDSLLPLLATLGLCAVYLGLHLLCRKKGLSLSYDRLLVCLLYVELFANLLYTTSHYALTSLYLIRSYPEATDYTASLKEENGFFRVSFPSSYLANTGMIYDVPSNSLFNSYVNKHQLYSGFLYGFFTGTNVTQSNYNGTPFSLSLCGVRYSFIPIFNSTPLLDLTAYEYLGRIEDYYVYENPDVLSLGVYTSDAALSFNPNEDLIGAYNGLSASYTGEETPLFTTSYICYSEDPSVENSFYFTDASGNLLSYDETCALYEDVKDSADATSISAIRMHLNLTPEASGSCYLYANEFVSLGDGAEGETLSVELPYPNPATDISEAYYVLTMNEEVYQAFITEAQKNQLENVTIQADTITGTTDYEKDGYTMLSLAYDKGWHAYLDGEEVEIEDPYHSIMMIKTPAGKHTLTLTYVPYGMKTSKLISLGFWILTMGIYGTLWIRKRRRQRKKA